MLDFQNEGMDDLETRLKQIQKAAEQVEEEGEVPFEKLFPTEFMKQHTRVESIETFFENGGWQVQNRLDMEGISRDELDIHVREHTEFCSWDRMQSTARTEYIKRELRREREN